MLFCFCFGNCNTDFSLAISHTQIQTPEGVPSLLGDLSLKEGVKLRVTSKFKKIDKSNSESGESSTRSTSLFTKLAPPPLATPISTSSSNQQVVDDEDFGEFEG